MSKVLFTSKTWGGDWQRILSGGFNRKWQSIGYPFDNIMLIMNNGIPEEGILALAELTPLVIPATPFSGNVYADAERTAVTIAQDFDYVVFVQGDCQTEGDWVTPGIEILENEPNVMVVSPGSEVNTWHDKDGYDHYMSDQAFLVRPQDFLRPTIFKDYPQDPDYPSYGGNSFEHMVGSYLKESGRTRKIVAEGWCYHGIS